MITVSQLIEELKRFPGHMPVVIPTMEEDRLGNPKATPLNIFPNEDDAEAGRQIPAVMISAKLIGEGDEI